MTNRERLQDTLPTGSGLTRTGWLQIFGCVACTVGIGWLSGCGSDEPAPAPIVAAPPTPVQIAPPKPRVTPVSELMVKLKIDDRIEFYEEDAPGSTEDRTAILEFFDGFARGDYASVGEMLSLADRYELDDLVDTGTWDRAIEDIGLVLIKNTGTNKVHGKCVLTVFEDYESGQQPQLWYYTGEGSNYTFEAAATPPDIIDKLTGTDWIQIWHDELEKELALADKPDENPDIPQVNLDDGSGSSSQPAAAKGRGPAAPRPGGPGIPGRRPPPKKKRRPPGPG